jgi:DNA-binding transcriptional regulator GbsR (MarR family)
MKEAEPAEPLPIVRRFIQDLGNTTQSLGVGRVVGQIYAYLYFSPEPRTLDDMQTALGISKGSASTAVRLLDQWAAVRKVWVKGDRKDYYEANDWFGQILKNALSDVVGKKLAACASLLENMETEFPAVGNGGAGRFIKTRVDHLRQFHDRTQKLWGGAIMQILLK